MCFKPYYKWITFNTCIWRWNRRPKWYSFKPYYKWITFNTQQKNYKVNIRIIVLNLIINGLPSILQITKIIGTSKTWVLNLIINGLPSIQNENLPFLPNIVHNVLNLIINGLPSIHFTVDKFIFFISAF